MFPSPRKNNGRRSLPAQSCSTTTTSSSLEKSVQFDDSGTSSITTSFSVSSTASDTLLGLINFDFYVNRRVLSKTLIFSV